jgi:hypothetical protein
MSIVDVRRLIAESGHDAALGAALLSAKLAHRPRRVPLLFFVVVLLLPAGEFRRVGRRVARAPSECLPIFDSLHLGPASSASSMARIVWRVALALSAIHSCQCEHGCSGRAGIHSLGLPHGWARLPACLLVLALVSLAFSRAGDAWSIDALMTATRTAGAEYLAHPYGVDADGARLLAPGIAARHGGAAWIASNMAVILLRSAYHTPIR